MMSHYWASWILLHIFVFLHFFASAPGEVYYALEFTDSIVSCPDFKNKHIQADSIKMQLTAGDDDEPESFGLNGDLEIFVPIDTDHDIQLEVCKETEVACEPMLSAQTSLCESMKEEDAPWFPVFLMMNVSSCPIPEGTYPIKNLILSIEPFKSCLSRDFCGYYAVRLAIVDKLDMLSCHMAYIEIVEKETE